LKNLELSQIFEQIAKILKIKGEKPFKIRAYVGKGCHPLTPILYLKRLEGKLRNGKPKILY
jgi:hypothetical protein